MSLSHSELLALVHYDPELGTWTRLQGKRRGKRTGCIDKSKGGYLFVVVKGKRYRAHQLAWFYIRGEWPTKLIDHRNRAKQDGSFKNLRDATKSQNGANAKLWSTNTSGFKGVSWDKSVKKWAVQIQFQKRHFRFGYFDCRPAAHFVHLVEYDKLFGEFANA